MAGHPGDELESRLRAANVARDPDDAFFAALADLAAASEPRASRRRPTPLRVAGVVVGTGILISGGAVASAFILINAGKHSGPQPQPPHTTAASVSTSSEAGSGDPTSTGGGGQPQGSQDSAPAGVGAPAAGGAPGPDGPLPGKAYGRDFDHPPAHAYGRDDQHPPGHAHGDAPEHAQASEHRHDAEHRRDAEHRPSLPDHAHGGAKPPQH